MTTELIRVLHTLFILLGLAARPLALPTAAAHTGLGRSPPKVLWDNTALGRPHRNEANTSLGQRKEQLYLHRGCPEQERGCEPHLVTCSSPYCDQEQQTKSLSFGHTATTGMMCLPTCSFGVSSEDSEGTAWNYFNQKDQGKLWESSL